MTRSIRAIVQDVIDNTDAADIGTQKNSDELTDEVCRALEAEGYLTTERSLEGLSVQSPFPFHPKSVTFDNDDARIVLNLDPAKSQGLLTAVYKEPELDRYSLLAPAPNELAFVTVTLNAQTAGTAGMGPHMWVHRT